MCTGHGRGLNIKRREKRERSAHVSVASLTFFFLTDSAIFRPSASPDRVPPNVQIMQRKRHRPGMLDRSIFFNYPANVREYTREERERERGEDER